MNKKKLTYLPINLLMSLPSFIVPWMLISNFTDLDWLFVGLISFYIYTNDAIYFTNLDYLQGEIDRVEKKIVLMPENDQTLKP